METMIERKIDVIHAPEGFPKPKQRTMKLPFYVKAIQWSFQNLGPVFPKFFGKIAWNLFQQPIKRVSHRRTDKLLETARTVEFLYEGETIKGYSWGEGHKTVLLVHGWESRGTAMRSFVPYLLEEGFRVVTIDAPAHGDSSGKKINPFKYSKVLAKVITMLGGVHTVVGHSFGGFSAAIMLNIVFPEIKVKNLVIVASFSHADVPFNEFQSFLGFNKKVQHYMYEMAAKETGIHPKQGDFRTVPKSENVENVLLVHDREDDVINIQSAYDYYNNWKDAQMIETVGYGHFRLLKAEPVIKKIVNFIIKK